MAKDHYPIAKTMKNIIKLNSLVILLALIATILTANFVCAAD